MRKHIGLALTLLVAGNLLSACSNSGSSTETTTPADSSSTATSSSTSAGSTSSTSTSSTTTTGSLSDPKSSIAYQLELIKAGDAEKLKTCLTPRVRDSVTQEVVDKAKTEAGKYTMDDLYASAEMSSDKKSAKVKMKGGRTLTTLNQTDGKWLADTVWFK